MLRHVSSRRFLNRLFPSFSDQRDTTKLGLSKFIDNENKNFDRFSDETLELRSKLHAEATAMLIPEGMSPPELNKGFFYYTRYEENGMLRFCRVPSDTSGKVMDIEKTNPLEQTILSLGDVASRFSSNNFSDVSAAKISIDNNILGFVVDVRGDERWSLMFRNLLTGEYTASALPLVRNFEWIDNTLVPGKFFYYTEMDPVTLRSVAVKRARLDSPIGELVWELSDKTSYVDLFKSKDGSKTFMSSSSKTMSEVYVVDSSDPHANPQLIRAPEKGVEYYCEYREGFIYIISNRDFVNFALYRMPLGREMRHSAEWELVYHSPDMTITDIDMFRKGIVLYGHGFQGEPAVEVLRFKGFANISTLSGEDDGFDGDEFGIIDKVKIPFKGNYGIGKIEVGVNGDFDADVCRFTFRSPRNPGTCLELDFAERRMEAIKVREFQHNARVGMDMQRVLVPSFSSSSASSSESTTGGVPLTIVAPEGNLKPSSPRPCLVFVYGAYGQVLEPDFSPAVTSLIDRGWIVAFAHVRGGGECGPQWHAEGSRMNRQNGIDDFKNCCDWLVHEGLTRREFLCAVGASAGGVVLGAALNQFGTSLLGGAAILRVPFVDLYDTLMDPNLPLSTHEQDEWGNVHDPVEGDFIRCISPKDNVRISDPSWYPPMLITSAEDDSRVPFEGVVKYAKMLRENVGIWDPNRLIVKTNRAGEGGHFGSASAAGNYEDTCIEIAFLLRSVGCPLE